MMSSATPASVASASIAPASIGYLALGDSYTIGEGIDASGCWPMQLSHALRGDGIPLADPRLIAATGWTTDELAAALDADAPANDHGLVSLLIGVNNQYRGRSADDYRVQFSGLLERAIAHAGARPHRVLVLSIPDWGMTPFATAQGRDRTQIADALDAFNTVARDVCDMHDVAFVDITALSRAHGSEVAMLADDGLHPSAAMYAQWMQLARPVTRRLLAR